MNVFKTCLLLLLSVALPVQAALAAGAGGCLRHMPVPPAHGAASATTHHPAATTVAGNDCAHHHAAALAAETPTETPADAPADTPNDATAVTGDPGCSSCGWCCLGTALPSPHLRWAMPAAQRVHALPPALQRASTVPRALERPPRADAAAH